MPRKCHALASETDALLPSLPSHGRRETKSRCYSLVAWIILVNLSLAGIAAAALLWFMRPPLLQKHPPFYAHITRPQGICGEKGEVTSHAGHIGLNGDREGSPKRSFFWYFQAQNDPENAPVILTIGGGPGTSGMANAMRAQGPCIMTANGTVSNPNAWTERFNLVALDHPIGAGYSYGSMINNSRAAAFDVYDFLQKFYMLYPHLAKNKFIISAGSYGGIYGPHIATVIHEQNRALARGEGHAGPFHINLDSLMISNPISDALSHFRWWLHQACYNTKLYNSITCSELYAFLPSCLQSIQFAYQESTVKNRITAVKVCQKLYTGDAHGTMPENTSKKCDGTVEDCFPEFMWLSDFMNHPSTKKKLGVPVSLKFQTLSDAVQDEFDSTGDIIQQAYSLYGPLLKDGIRLLHYVGAKDANCGWPGIVSFLKLLRSPYQERFINAPDVPWPSAVDATVRVVGEGAGGMTYILIADGGHFVAADQPTLVKNIIQHWIDNRPFV